jgi:hypothetical protein
MSEWNLRNFITVLSVYADWITLCVRDKNENEEKLCEQLRKVLHVSGVIDEDGNTSRKYVDIFAKIVDCSK